MKNKKRFNTLLLILVFFAGLSLLLYPSIANYINEKHQTRAISAYDAGIAEIGEAEYEKMLESAHAYNEGILKRYNYFSPSGAEKKQYKSLLDPVGSGMMGYIEISSIDVTLPIYHGTSDEVLESAVGHMDWSSLPVGGESTHCVLSGHRGLPSAKLFTHLDELAEGDIFHLRVLNEVLTYEVDQILIVDPLDTESLQIEKGADYCTLVTCTPYGINTHRLLVRGHRIASDSAALMRITSEAVQIEPMITAAVAGIPALMIMLAIVFFSGSNKRRDSNRGGKK